MQFASMPFNYVDILVVLVLLWGVMRGKKRGISEELLDVFQWLAIVVLCAMLYQPVGQFLASYTHMHLLFSYVVTYLFFLLVIKLVFTVIKRIVGEKLVHGDMFGKLEYYLGMIAGAVRFGCMIIVAMALLNARYISPEQIAAEERARQASFGDVSFYPTFGTVQQAVFVEAASGRFARTYLAEQLIVPTAVKTLPPLREGPARRRERLVDEVINDKPKR